ncbi:MAG: hypothetical protein ABW168_04285 [Sedimenticola sp.]
MIESIYHLLWERAFSYGFSFSPSIEAAVVIVILHSFIMFLIKGVEVRRPLLVFGFVGKHAIDHDDEDVRYLNSLAYAGWVLLFVIQVFFYKMPILNVKSRRESFPMLLTASLFILGGYFVLGWSWVLWTSIL